MDRLRIDKWLWAARFYKTRSLACDEIDKGRVLVNGVAVKPAREVKADDLVQLRQGVVSRTVMVLGVSDKRGSAPVAALLFEETQESMRSRLQAAAARRIAPEPALSLVHGRPTKLDRRQSESLRQRTVESARDETPDWGDRWSASLDP